MKLNRLANESSPYLKQHAGNPVDWYAWSEEAVKKAKQENKPILLSIGYAACHWCHVMAEESFNDPETADLMNKFFVNIKVDREERPDLDKIYQTAHYILSQQTGGWPLTIFLSPNLVPFFSGTYFPPLPSYHLPAFKQVLVSIHTLYQQQSLAIEQQNQEVLKILKYERKVDGAITITDVPVQEAVKNLQASFDKKNGGFNDAPKFPQVPKLNFLLHLKPDLTYFSLDKILLSGLTDQLAGGFFRYTVDAEWHIPHFEKMLYDNGLLLQLLALAYRFRPNQNYSNGITTTIEWLMSMHDSTGGFYASLDADSEHEEGKYYLWRASEIQELLTGEEYTIAQVYFCLDKSPPIDSKYHLRVACPIDELAHKLDMDPGFIAQQISVIKQKLKQVRRLRTLPFVDEKILTSWNALVIKGLILSAECLQSDVYLQTAQASIDFILKTSWQNGRLYTVIAAGQGKNLAFLDDYAYMIDALLTFIQTEWRSDYLHYATELMASVIRHFVHDSGGFYFTSDEHEVVLYRPQTFMDEAVPSANGVLLRQLLLLGHLLGNTQYLTLAEKLLKQSYVSIVNYPHEHCTLLLGLMEFLRPSWLVILRGSLAELKKWKKSVKKNAYVFCIPTDETNLPEVLALRKPVGDICAYLCQGSICSDVITDFSIFKDKMS